MSNMTIDINGKCNISCKFCYQNLDGSELSYDQVMGFVEDSSADVVEIGGGEPLLHKDLMKIMKSTTNLGKKVHISTNATFIPDGFLDLDDYTKEQTQVQISLHASNPWLYKQIVGKNLFDDVVRNTRTLSQHYTTLMTSAIYKDNFDDVPNLLSLSKSLEIPIRINLAFPIESGIDVDLLDDVQIDQLRGFLLGQNIQTKGRVDSPLIHQNNCSALENFYGIKKVGDCPMDCGAKNYVSPRGQVSFCEFVPVSVGGERI